MGLDHKDTLLRKAELLNLYNKLVVADANKRLPFDDGSFNSVFSDIIYWLDDPLFVFSEIQRVLKPNGKLCVFLPDSTWLDASFYYNLYVRSGRPDSWKFLELIDRGRTSDNVKVVKKRREWEDMFKKSGFDIIECRPHLSKTLMQVNDIGLRPLFPFLKKMVTNIEKEQLLEIKRKWVDFFETVGNSLIQKDDDETMKQGVEHCYLTYILSKR